MSGGSLVTARLLSEELRARGGRQVAGPGPTTLGIMQKLAKRPSHSRTMMTEAGSQGPVTTLDHIVGPALAVGSMI